MPQLQTLVTVEEYLSTHYDPDREYLNGELTERNVGEYDHARTQTLMSIYLGTRERIWSIRAVVEQRVQVRPERYRVPDLCVVRSDYPRLQVFTRPPLICVEILSPDDTLDAIQERIDDYLAFGVESAWVVSPRLRRGWIHERGSIEEAQNGVLRTTSAPQIVVPLAEVFEDPAS